MEQWIGSVHSKMAWRTHFFKIWRLSRFGKELFIYIYIYIYIYTLTGHLVTQIANQPITWQQLNASRCAEYDLLKFKPSIRMGKKGDLSDFERGMVVGARRAGLSISKTADLLGFSCTTISRVYREWFKKEKISSERQLCGWKCLFDVRSQRRMGRLVRDDRKTTVTQITTLYNLCMQNTISEHTTRRILKQMGNSSRRPHRVLLLSDKNRTRRLQFTQTHQNSPTIEDWNNVAWFDESRFLLRHSDGRVRIWREEHERMDSSCLVSTVQADGGGVMVWGIFSWHTLGPLVPIEHCLNATVFLSIVVDHVKVKVKVSLFVT